MSKKLIVIDPGHCPADPGFTYQGVTEHEIVLDIAKRVERHLFRKYLVDVTVYQSATATTSAQADQHVVQFANDQKADYLLSIHLSGDNVTGYRSFTRTSAPLVTSSVRAETHNRFITTSGYVDRGKSTSSSIYVINNAQMPSAEHCILCLNHAGDFAILNNVESREAIAFNLANSIANAMNLRHKDIGQSIPVIIIDAGHGGTDNGAVNGSLKEKDVTYYVAFKVREMLKRNYYVEAYAFQSRTATDSLQNDNAMQDFVHNLMIKNIVADHYLSFHCGNSGSSGFKSFICPSWMIDDNILIRQRAEIHDTIAEYMISKGFVDLGKYTTTENFVGRSTNFALFIRASQYDILTVTQAADAVALANQEFLDGVADAVVRGLVKALHLQKRDQPRLPIVVIDSGHGGTDDGNVHGGIKEKDLTLSFAKHVRNYLNMNYPVDARVFQHEQVVTNATQEFELPVQYANDVNADYFISLHVNKAAGATQGYESYTFTHSAKHENSLREVIHNRLITGMNIYARTNRGMKTGDLYPCKETVAPASLFELLFIDHPDDHTHLINPAFIKHVGQYLAEGIANALNLEATYTMKGIEERVIQLNFLNPKDRCDYFASSDPYSYTGSNYSEYGHGEDGHILIGKKSNGHTYKSYMYFDLERAIPKGSILLNAKFVLHYEDVINPGNYTHPMYIFGLRGVDISPSWITGQFVKPEKFVGNFNINMLTSSIKSSGFCRHEISCVSTIFNWIKHYYANIAPEQSVTMYNDAFTYFAMGVVGFSLITADGTPALPNGTIIKLCSMFHPDVTKRPRLELTLIPADDNDNGDDSIWQSIPTTGISYVNLTKVPNSGLPVVTSQDISKLRLADDNNALAVTHNKSTHTHSRVDLFIDVNDLTNAGVLVTRAAIKARIKCTGTAKNTCQTALKVYNSADVEWNTDVKHSLHNDWMYFYVSGLHWSAQGAAGHSLVRDDGTIRFGFEITNTVNGDATVEIDHVQYLLQQTETKFSAEFGSVNPVGVGIIPVQFNYALSNPKYDSLVPEGSAGTWGVDIREMTFDDVILSSTSLSYALPSNKGIVIRDIPIAAGKYEVVVWVLDAFSQQKITSKSFICNVVAPGSCSMSDVQVLIPSTFSEYNQGIQVFIGNPCTQSVASDHGLGATVHVKYAGQPSMVQVSSSVTTDGNGHYFVKCAFNFGSYDLTRLDHFELRIPRCLGHGTTTNVYVANLPIYLNKGAY